MFQILLHQGRKLLLKSHELRAWLTLSLTRVLGTKLHVQVACTAGLTTNCRPLPLLHAHSLSLLCAEQELIHNTRP